MQFVLYPDLTAPLCPVVAEEYERWIRAGRDVSHEEWQYPRELPALIEPKAHPSFASRVESAARVG